MSSFHSLPYRPLPSVVGKILGTISGLVLLTATLEILFPAAKSACKDFQYLSWIKTPCTVTAVKASGGQSYKLGITYKYSVAGREFTSSRYSPNNHSCFCSTISQKNDKMDEYREGASAICYVNPHDPAKAVLTRSLAGPLFPLIFFLVFLSVSIRILVTTWRKAPKKRLPDDTSSRQRDFTQPQSTHSSRHSSIDYVALLIGALFTGIGIFIFTLFLNKTFKYSGEWDTTEGTVITSRVERHHTKNGTSYSPYVAYTYEVDGVKYENDTYKAGGIFTSSGHGNASAIVENHRPGAKTTVHYDVKKPRLSALVVNTEKNLADYVIFIFPSIFIVLGGTVLISSLKPFLGDLPFPSRNMPVAGMQLKRIRDVQGKIFFTILWCSFCLMFTTIWFTQGDIPFSWTKKFWTFDKFFVLIFPAIGVGLIISCIKSAIIEILTGHYSVEVSAASLTPGALLQVNYAFSHIDLKHQEIEFFICQTATERVGGDACGDHHFGGAHDGVQYSRIEHESEAYATQNPSSLSQGSFSCTIPPAVEGHSLTWQLVVRYGKKKDVFKLPVKKACGH